MTRKNSWLHVTAVAGVLGLLAIAAPAFAASQEQVLYSFCSITGCTDGYAPSVGLVFDAAGNLYGTTTYGGTYNNGICEQGCGTVFELSPNSNGTWTQSTLYSFDSNSSQDGTNPVAGLVFDASGNLYGTTEAGGSNCGATGCGTVFELLPGANGTWTEKVLYSFNNNGDGSWPSAALILDAAGNLYGTTYRGGTHGWGTVFELSPGANGTWTEKVLHSFSRNRKIGDGFEPTAGLLLDGSGNLYGTTTMGGVVGSACKPYGCGAVFELSPGTNGNWTEKVLHSFNGTDGRQLKAGLVFDEAGNLYGTASSGGNSSNCNGGCGTVFELSPGTNGKWKGEVLHTFSGKDGAVPEAALVFDSNGNLYSTTVRGGGSVGAGTVFKLSPDANGKWKESKLYTFREGEKYGAGPTGIAFGVSGNLYGTTNVGGAYGAGTVFEITP